MLNLEEWMDVKDLQRQGHSIRSIAEMTGRSRNTVRRQLREAVPPTFQAPQRSSKLDAFKPYVEKRYLECNLSCVRMLQELQAMGYTGSVDLVLRYVRTLKPAKKGRQKLTVRFETPPGQQAQADWAYCGRFPNASGQVTSVYAFVVVLSFSRTMYVEFTTDMKLETLIRCHVNAFSFFGGWPQSILYDNMKQVKLDVSQWNPLFLDFAGHYGLTPKTHAIRRPRTKGKVERMVLYVKDGFLNGRSFVDLDDLNTQGRAWLDHTANARLHSTTNQRPCDLMAKEGLTPLGSIAPYQISVPVTRTVDWEGYVHYARSRYSVPPLHAGHSVTIVQRDGSIRIRHGDQLIAEHPNAPRPGSCMAKEEHLSELWRLSVQRHGVPGDSLPHWQLTFADSVATADLRRYESMGGYELEAAGPREAA
jgi:transposase